MSDPFGDTAGPTFRVVPAVRKQTAALIALWGMSDSGKTYSGLRLARGLVGPKGNIGLADTENGRALLYAGKFGGWNHIDFQPPFTPERYTAAMNSAAQAGMQCIVFDSMSHVWQGEGGVLEQRDRINQQGLGAWKGPKTAYIRMTQALFRAPIHVIFCLRAKDKNVQIGKGKDAQIVNMGHVPVCDPQLSLVYECTVVCHMESGSRKPLDPVKAPEDIAHVIRPGEYITEEAGAQIAAFLAGGRAVDKEAEELQRQGRSIATEGMVALKTWWDGLTKTQKPKAKPILDELKSIAAQVDAEGQESVERAALQAEGQDALSDGFTPPARSAA